MFIILLVELSPSVLKYLQSSIIINQIKEMQSGTNKTYTYTLYQSYGLQKPETTSSKLSQSVFTNNSSYRPGHINTVYSHLPQRMEEPLANSRYENVLKSSFTSKVDVENILKKEQAQKPPITYAYKSPGCGINMSGKSKFEMKGDMITVKLDKILNSRKGKSGTLQLEIVRMSYFYDGVSGMKPSEYTSVGTSELGQLQGGWSFTEVVRVMQKNYDEEHSYRKCYILLLEEYDQGQFKIVDYVNFD